MKKCVLINCFASSNEMRVEPIREYLIQMGYETIYISSDFNHAQKKYIDLPSDITSIHTLPYKKNISIARLYSHYIFSRKVYRKLCEYKPEIVYIKFPPNFLVKVAFIIKNKLNCKIILDLFDLWPESLPIPVRTKKMIEPVTKLWAGLRDKYMKYADVVLTECNMYKYVLKEFLPANVYTLYLMKEDIPYKFPIIREDNNIRLCYLGGINNLINIDLICLVISNLSKRHYVSLDVIGDGVSKNLLIEKAKESGAEVQFHGVIFDEVRKYEIMSRCDYGLNLMKDNVMVALSIKSIEYFRAGLALISNLRFDTEQIIASYQAGINYKEIDYNYIEDKINIYKMKKNARKVYMDLFSSHKFRQNLDEALKELFTQREENAIYS